MDNQYLNHAKVFKAFCDENRLMILEMLQSGEKCACVLLEKLEITQPTLSHHMKILCDSGIVSPRKEGKWTHYALSESGSGYALALLKKLTAVKTEQHDKERCCESHGTSSDTKESHPMNQPRVNEAVTCYLDGFNCAQAVVSAYCEELGLDKKTAMQLACGFGAGMGRRQETCGAVSGACLLIGLKHGKYLQEDNAAKEKTYAMVREFTRLFEERNKTISCRELLGIDLNHDNRQQVMARLKTVCPKMVQDAAEIIETLL